MRRRLAGFVVVTMLMSGCGASNDDGPSGDADGAAEPTGDRVEEYCELAVAEDALVSAFDPLTATAEQTEGLYRAVDDMADRAAAVAPAEIESDLATQRDVLRRTIELLENAGWNLTTVAADLAPIYEDPAYLAADERLEQHAVSVCGLDTEAGSDAVTAVDPELAAYCAAAAEVAQRGEVPADADPDTARAYYEGLIADLDRLESLAPADLAESHALLSERFDEVAAIIASVGWDLDTGLAAVEEWTADPEISGPMLAAVSVVETFEAEVCGLSLE